MQALADVTHPDAGTFANQAADGRGCSAAGLHANAIVFDLEQEPLVDDAAAEDDGAAADAWLEAMLDAVLDERLEDHAGDDDVERVG